MLIAGNWKMHKGPDETREFCARLRARLHGLEGVDVIVCPPFPSLHDAVGMLATTEIAVFAQNAHWAKDGPYTGEVSPWMLKEQGIGGTLVAHSERRQLFGETDESAALRIEGALDAGLHVIACVGETEGEREAGETADVVERQVQVIETVVAKENVERLAIAYEPVWAIGTGRNATPEQAEEAHRLIKRVLDVPVLYGGSVKPGERPRPALATERRRRARRRRVARGRLVRSDLRSRSPLVALVILDGWGCAPAGPGNGVSLANTPVFDRLWAEFPHTTLEASGEAVGLPPGQMGNSEVGHLTIGSGRVLDQDLQRVNRAVRDGSLFENEALVEAFRRARERGGNVHLLSLVSYGGVHSHIEHVRALLELARREGMEDRTWLHAFTDGRDVSPTSAVRDLAELPVERIATVVGRYYAMDRDQRWERTQLALEAILDERCRCTSTSPQSLLRYVQQSYDAGTTDEFLLPIIVQSAPRLDPARDAAIFVNFRPDRARQLTAKLLEAGVDLTTMTRYRDDFDARRLRRGGGAANARGGPRLARPPPAPLRGDREVRPCHVLLQRRPRGGVARGDADPRPEPERRPELRPQAGDGCARGRLGACAPSSNPVAMPSP